MIQALEDGGRVELRGFGALSVRSRDARAGRNPRTGEAVPVKAKKAPKATLGATFKKTVNKEIPAPKLAGCDAPRDDLRVLQVARQLEQAMPWAHRRAPLFDEAYARR
jgi:hypothetical protein